MAIANLTRDIFVTIANGDMRAVAFLETLGFAAVPSGGSVGQALVKTGINDWEMAWQTVAGGGGATWGGITGTLSAQSDLIAALNGKQPISAVLTATTASFTTTLETKLAGIAAGATANATDAFLLARTNHTGTQLAATISDFSTAVAATAAVTANTAKVTNANHTGDASGSTVLTLATVNSNVGSFGLAGSVAQFTVNAKGLITAAANVAISIAATAISDATAAGRAMLTAATAAAQTALLDVFTSGAKGLAPASGGGTTNFLRADGTWVAPPGGGGGVSDGDKGDITVSGGGLVWTIDANAVGNTKLAQIATATIKGRVTAGTGDVEDLNGTQVTTLLDAFTTTLKGVVPASGGGTTNFLRADGTWVAPPGGVTVAYGRLTSNFVLNNVATQQRLFNWSTNGALTLATGTYEFEMVINLSGMSATSGNAALSILGAGTAVIGTALMTTHGRDGGGIGGTQALSQGGAQSLNGPQPSVIVGTGTTMYAKVVGMFDVTTAGTIIPSITLLTASAASVLTGSYFKCNRIGDTGVNTQGSWS